MLVIKKGDVFRDKRHHTRHLRVIAVGMDDIVCDAFDPAGRLWFRSPTFIAAHRFERQFALVSEERP